VPIRGEAGDVSDAPEPGLDPFDRMLLTVDGRVDPLLEACTGEPITTRTTRLAGPATLEQLLTATGGWWHPDAGLLELAPTDQLIARRAILCGVRSGAAYVLAESLVVPDRLPGVDAEGFGRVLTDGRLETRREVLGVTAARAGEASDHLGVGPGATLVWRTYRVVVRRRAAAVVTEWLAPGRLAAAAVRSREP
jgi:chorismate-pyruvate lyase